MNLNYKIIVSFLGILLMINGLFMLFCLPVSYIYTDYNFVFFLVSGLSIIALGAAAFFFTRNNQRKEIKKKEGYLIVTLGWLIMALSGTIPYMVSGTTATFTNAFFETMSGYTTTGASILRDIESVDKSILFWRSLTQWIGGMGIIVLAVAVLPLLGIGGMQLFGAESPGLSPDKIHPRITSTAKRLWLIYVILTATETLLLTLAGMDLFDSICHAMTTIATGGFSTKNASIQHYDSSLIHWIIIVFMFLAGTNFTLTYFAAKGKLKKLWENDEWKSYFFGVATIVIVVTFTLGSATHKGFPTALRDAAFQVISIITTTGFVTDDYTNWGTFLMVLCFLLMFIGGCAGSTSGGIKVVRHVMLLKNSILELKRLLHPSAIIPVRFNGRAVSQDITLNVLAFFLIYFTIFVLGCLSMSWLGLDFKSTLGAVATTLGNIGPGIGSVGPMFNFYEVPVAGKWILSGLMLLGRLELFTVLILLTPFFWQRN